MNIPNVVIRRPRVTKVNPDGSVRTRKKSNKPRVAVIEYVTREMFERETANIFGSPALNAKVLEFEQVTKAFKLAAALDDSAEFNRLDAIRSKLIVEINILRTTEFSSLGPMITKVRRLLKVYAKRNNREVFAAVCSAVAPFFPDAESVKEFWATIETDTTETA